MIIITSPSSGSLRINNGGVVNYLCNIYTSDIIGDVFMQSVSILNSHGQNIISLPINKITSIGGTVFAGTLQDAVDAIAALVEVSGVVPPPPVPTVPYVPAVSGLWASYDMSVTAGVIQSGGNVTQVIDNSGNNRNLTKTYVIFPTYTAAGDVDNFGHINITSTDKKDIYQDGFSLDGPITMYAAIKQTGFSENGSLLSIGPIWNALRQQTYFDQEVIRPTRFSNGTYYSRNALNQKWQILSWVANEANSFLRINNQYNVQFTVGTNTNVIDTIALGKEGSEADFQIGQWHIVQGLVSDADDLTIRTNMMSRFSPVDTHMYLANGDSVTQGTSGFFDDVWGIYAEQVTAALSRNIYNLGLSGARVFNYPNEPTGIDFVDTYTKLFTVNPANALVSSMYGINDALVLTGSNPHDSDYIALWKAQYKAIWQAILDYGYSPSNCLICSTIYEPTRPLCELFRAPCSEIAAELGIKYYDAWAYTLANGGPGWCATNVHPQSVADCTVIKNGFILALA